MSVPWLAEGSAGPEFTTALRRIADARSAGAQHRAIELATLQLNRRPPRGIDSALRVERAKSLMIERRWSEAERDCRRALAGHERSEVQALLAECLLQQKKSGEAVRAIEAALAAGEHAAQHRALYARALSAEGRHDEACSAAERAQQQEPALRNTWLHVLSAAGRHAEVIHNASSALDLDAGGAEHWTLLGLSLDALGRSREAAAALREAVRLEPERVDANCGLGMALLRLGDYRGGFRHYEYRQRAAGRRRLGVPPWRGEALALKHLVVRAEQGLGDTLQFARFLPLTRKLAAETTLISPPGLGRVLQSNSALGPTLTTPPPFGLGDYQTLIMSLPHHLGLGEDIRAAQVPYLFAEPALVDSWRARLPPGPKIALAWQGNPQYAGDRYRSMPWAHYEKLLVRQGDRARWLSLQKGPGSEQLRASPLAPHVLDLAEQIDGGGEAFVDSLAILSQLDLLITTDNGLAHLAGAGGVRTWLLLGTAPDWRWGLSGDSTAWYPNTRLFRQTSSGDWAGVIDALDVELDTFLSARGYPAPV